MQNIHLFLHSFFASDPHHGAYYIERIVLGILFGLGLLGGLQIVPPSARKSVIAIVTFLGGAFYALEFFLPHFRIPWTGGGIPVNLTSMLPALGTLSTVFQAFAIGLGIVNLLGLHFKNIARKRAGWGNSIVLLFGFVAMLLWGLLNAYNPGGAVILNRSVHTPVTMSIFGLHPHFTIVLPYFSFLNAPITNIDIYDFLFYGGYANLDSSMFALIGFFIVSASYRAFRIRTVEASLLMLAAVIVMLGQVTLGTSITANLPTTGLWSNFRFENLGLFLLKEFNAPAFRAINFGIGVGFLATSLRLWLSLERGAYFDAES